MKPPINPILKNPKPAIRVDHEAGLIHIPGKDPLPLTPTIQQRFDANGRPYQHVLTPDEMRDAERKNNLRLQVIRECLMARWFCKQCGRTWKGTETRVAHDNVAGNLSEYLHCPGEVPEGKCLSPLTAVDATPITSAIERGEIEL